VVPGVVHGERAVAAGGQQRAFLLHIEQVRHKIFLVTVLSHNLFLPQVPDLRFAAIDETWTSELNA